jgi:hypothetical protein
MAQNLILLLSPYDHHRTEGVVGLRGGLVGRI